MRSAEKSPAIPIIYEDNHLLVATKPPNLLSQGDQSGDASILDILKEDIKLRYKKPGNVYLGLVHRLDRPVGGIMVFAKTSKAAARLSEQVRLRQFDKRYLAVIHGNIQPSEGRLENYLKKNARNNMVQVAASSQEGAKKAILEYINLYPKNGLSLVGVHLLTGRSHQIRVQLANAGYPLYGDQKYGPLHNQPGQQIALWSWKIAFQHPTLKERMEFTCPCPNEPPWTLFPMSSLLPRADF